MKTREAYRTTAKEAGIKKGVVFEIDDPAFAEELARRIGEAAEAIDFTCPCYYPKQCCDGEPSEKEQPAFLPQDLLHRELFIGVAEGKHKRGFIRSLLSLFKGSRR
ncbi:MAG: hypothetical protein HQL09_06485 [Nitrospirae bacterium]|nr:hypothetical protein [Nitrospirota bacterium]